MAQNESVQGPRVCRDLEDYTLDSVKHDMNKGRSCQQSVGICPGQSCLKLINILSGKGQILGLTLTFADTVVGQMGRDRKSPGMTRHDFIIESSSHVAQCAPQV